MTNNGYIIETTENMLTEADFRKMGYSPLIASKLATAYRDQAEHSLKQFHFFRFVFSDNNKNYKTVPAQVRYMECVRKRLSDRIEILQAWEEFPHEFASYSA
jgi:hypothetical protein